MAKSATIEVLIQIILKRKSSLHPPKVIKIENIIVIIINLYILTSPRHFRQCREAPKKSMLFHPTLGSITIIIIIIINNLMM